MIQEKAILRAGGVAMDTIRRYGGRGRMGPVEETPRINYLKDRWLHNYDASNLK
jgi:hypothetical protein